MIAYPQDEEIKGARKPRSALVPSPHLAVAHEAVRHSTEKEAFFRGWLDLVSTPRLEAELASK